MSEKQKIEVTIIKRTPRELLLHIPWMWYSVDANKMDCRHEPRDPVAVFVHVCKHCGVPIEARSCMACDGMGRTYTTDMRCCVCRGTGIDRWEAAT